MESGDRIKQMSECNRVQVNGSINLDKYIEKDNTTYKKKANMWMRDDFSGIVKENMRRKRHENK